MQATTLKWGAAVLGSAAIGYVVGKSLYERYEQQVNEKLELAKLLGNIFAANIKSRLTGVPVSVLLAKQNPEFGWAANTELNLVGIGPNGFAGNADDTQEVLAMPLTEDFLKFLDDLVSNGPTTSTFGPATSGGRNPKGEVKP